MVYYTQEVVIFNISLGYILYNKKLLKAKFVNLVHGKDVCAWSCIHLDLI